ncbi:MAG: redoxin domain-containing protein [bacterium]
MAGTTGHEQKPGRSRSSKIATWGFWGVVIIVLFFIFQGVFGSKLEQGDIAPDLEVTLEGQEYESSLAELCSDRPALLVFVTPGCYACQAQLSSLGYRKKDVPFDVYVVTRRSGEWLEQEFEKAGSSFPVVLDPGSELHRTFRVAFYPTSALLGTDRKLVFKTRGFSSRLTGRAKLLIKEEAP